MKNVAFGKAPPFTCRNEATTLVRLILVLFGRIKVLLDREHLKLQDLDQFGLAQSLLS